MIYAFISGMVLALGLIFPLGLQNVFIFNQGATQKHFTHALPSVFAATICDSLLIILAVTGVSILVLKLAWLKIVIFTLGFIFLSIMGWITWRSTPTRLTEGYTPLSPQRQIAFAVSVSLLNPHALIDAFGVIGTSALHFEDDAKWAYTFGCIFISLCWFFGLAVAGHFLHKLDKSGWWLMLFNKISALIIWGVALYLGYQVITFFIF